MNVFSSSLFTPYPKFNNDLLTTNNEATTAQQQQQQRDRTSCSNNVIGPAGSRFDPMIGSRVDHPSLLNSYMMMMQPASVSLTMWKPQDQCKDSPTVPSSPGSAQSGFSVSSMFTPSSRDIFVGPLFHGDGVNSSPIFYNHEVVVTPKKQTLPLVPSPPDSDESARSEKRTSEGRSGEGRNERGPSAVLTRSGASGSSRDLCNELSPDSGVANSNNSTPANTPPLEGNSPAIRGRVLNFDDETNNSPEEENGTTNNTTNQVQDLINEVAYLRRMLASKDAELREFKDRFTAFVIKQEEDKKIVTEAFEKMQEELQRRSIQVNHFTLSIADMTSNMRAIQSQRDDLLESNKKLLSEAARAVTMLKALEANYQNEQKKAKKYEEEMIKDREKKKSIESRMLKEIQELNARYNKGNAEKIQLQLELAHLRKENAELQKQVRAISGSATTAQSSSVPFVNDGAPNIGGRQHVVNVGVVNAPPANANNPDNGGQFNNSNSNQLRF